MKRRPPCIALPGHGEPFYGAHQGGITTPAQKHLYFAAFDIITDKRADVEDLLRRWTEASARLTAGLFGKLGLAAHRPEALGTGGLWLGQQARRNTEQPDGVQGWHHEP